MASTVPGKRPRIESYLSSCASVSEPGLTQGHASGSYSAFLRDPDGYEVEVTIGAD